MNYPFVRLLVHAHVYYPELWAELAVAIRHICGTVDLYITMVKEDPALQQRILSEFPQAKILLLPNTGYDILPFLKVLQQVDLSRYDYLVKLHTKRSFPPFFSMFKFPCKRFLSHRAKILVNGNLWRNYLLRFLRSPELFRQCISTFERNPRWGAIADSCISLDYAHDDDPSAYTSACSFLEGNGYPVQHFKFVAGTMFVARAKLFSALQKFEIRDDMFDIPDDRHTQSFAHVMERVLGGIIYAQGYEIHDIAPYKTRMENFLLLCGINLIALFFETRETASGYRLIKICKIPVWHKKIVRK